MNSEDKLAMLLGAIDLDATNIKEQCDGGEYCEWPNCSCMDSMHNTWRKYSELKD